MRGYIYKNMLIEILFFNRFILSTSFVVTHILCIKFDNYSSAFRGKFRGIMKKTARTKRLH